MKSIFLMKNYLFLVLIITIQACKPTPIIETPESNLGEIHIEVSGSDEAVPVFTEGMLLMHSFEFKDAAEKFAEAQKIDPDFGMAYWGEAMTKNHALWRQQELDEAREILEKLGATEEEKKSKFKTAFEQDMFAAISVLYGKGTKKERDKAYANFMADLHDKYPDNHEIAAFYALSVLGSNEDKRNDELYSKGAKIAQSVIDENPNHPGALHYLIHSYDDPINAHKALNAANRYSKIAPDAAHALHMPSHIYVALGMWDEVISSNIAAWEASEKRKAEKGLDNDALNYHSLKWLMYGHLQKGEFAQAKKLVEEMETYCLQEPSSKAKSHTIMMKGAYFSETNEWFDPLVIDTVDYEDLSIQPYGTYAYIRGMKAFHENDKASLAKIITTLTSKNKDAESEALIGNSQMCSGSYGRGRPTTTQVDRTKVVILELQAQLALLQKDDDLAEKLIKEAIKIEEKTAYMYGPPEIVKPSHEMYAEWLMKRKRFKEAKSFYNKVLERAPKRYIAIEGKKSIDKVI